jgi:hypothetical protein
MVVYGSANAGWHVAKKNLEMNSKMEVIGRKLNLKAHWAGIREVEKLVGPCDIEGHLGTDGRMYICDFARCFPPETPSK